MMRSDIICLLNNAASDLEALPKRNYPHAAGTAFAVREAAENLQRAFEHRHLIDEFARLYCLQPDDIARRRAREVGNG